MAGSSVYARMSRLSAIIVILPATMGAGAFLGYFVIDRYLGTFPWGTIVMVLAGSGIGFYEIVRILMRDQHDHSRSKEN